MDAFLAIDELRATAQHIGLVDRKLETLTRARIDSWQQLMAATARLYRAGSIDYDGLVRIYEAMKAGYGTGFTRLWDEHMPIPALRVQYYRSELPNGPAGSWFGDVPIGPGMPAPPVGVAVVYVLFAAGNVPVYVGSTDFFRNRIKVHRKEKPEACRWTAYRCRDREHAYEVEDRLLKEHKPRMNKRAGR